MHFVNTATVIPLGQNYKIPPEVRACYEKHEGNYTEQAACLPPDNYIDSILALDLDTGKVCPFVLLAHLEL
jgi:hypothetical protein